MVALAALLAGLAVLALRPPADGRLQRVLPRPERRRLQSLPGAAGRASPGPARKPSSHGSIEPPGPRPGATGPPDARRGHVSPAVLASLAAAAALAVLLPFPVGPLAGLVVAGAGPRVLAGLEPAGTRARREQLAADLPLLLDLLSSCLAGGASLPHAAAAVSAAVPGPAGERLAEVAAQLAVGTPPGQAWAGLTGDRPDDPLAPAARALGRAAEGGAPVAAAVARLAADARAQARAQGQQAARRVGVVVVAPLGLCFLPAFVLIGVVPVVAGLVGPLLDTL